MWVPADTAQICGTRTHFAAAVGILRSNCEKSAVWRTKALCCPPRMLASWSRQAHFETVWLWWCCRASTCQSGFVDSQITSVQALKRWATGKLIRAYAGTKGTQRLGREHPECHGGEIQARMAATWNLLGLERFIKLATRKYRLVSCLVKMLRGGQQSQQDAARCTSSPSRRSSKVSTQLRARSIALCQWHGLASRSRFVTLVASTCSFRPLAEHDGRLTVTLAFKASSQGMPLRRGLTDYDRKVEVESESGAWKISQQGSACRRT